MKSETQAELVADLADEWDSLPNDIRSEMILRCPRLYFTAAYLARREQVARQMARERA